MAKRPKYDDEFRASAVVMLESQGYPHNAAALERIAKYLKVPGRTLRRWFNGTSNPPPDRVVSEKKIDLKAAISAELAAIFATMHEARDDASYKDLATAAGILIDKQQLLSGEPTARIETMERLLNELPTDEYDAIIREAEEVLAATRRRDSGGPPAADDADRVD